MPSCVYMSTYVYLWTLSSLALALCYVLIRKIRKIRISNGIFFHHCCCCCSTEIYTYVQNKQRDDVMRSHWFVHCCCCAVCCCSSSSSLCASLNHNIVILFLKFISASMNTLQSSSAGRVWRGHSQKIYLRFGWTRKPFRLAFESTKINACRLIKLRDGTSASSSETAVFTFSVNGAPQQKHKQTKKAKDEKLARVK